MENTNHTFNRDTVASAHNQLNMPSGTKGQTAEEHTQRLKQILMENKKAVHNIAKDGNCFFNSGCHQVRCTNPGLDGTKFRNIVCDHLVEKEDCYSLFIELKDGEKFESKIEAELRTSGRWNTALGDLLPLAVANLFQSSVEIFSSKDDCPHLMIVPDLSLPEHESVIMNHSSSIQFVYTAIPGREHYDSCMDKSSEDDKVHEEVLTDDDDLYEGYFQDKPAKMRQLSDSENAFVADYDDNGNNPHEIAFVVGDDHHEIPFVVDDDDHDIAFIDDDDDNEDDDDHDDDHNLDIAFLLDDNNNDATDADDDHDLDIAFLALLD